MPVALRPTPLTTRATVPPVSASGISSNRRPGINQPSNCSSRIPNMLANATIRARRYLDALIEALSLDDGRL